MTSPRKLLVFAVLAALVPVATGDVTIVGDAEQPVVRYVRSQALLIGISDYTAGWDDLPSIPDELAQVRSALEFQGFEVETVPDPGDPRMVDEAALRNAIESFIDRHGYESENRLLIFFAGHGYTRNVAGTRRGYLVPADAPQPTSGKVGAFLRKTVPMTDVVAWARKIEARHALFVFDSCFSGTVFDWRSDLPQPAYITSLTGRPVRQFLTAGRAGELVPAKSVFTPAFVRALGSAADLTRDGYVTGTELGVYLHQEVAGSGQTPQYGKLPDAGFREGDFVFRLPFGAPPEEVLFDVSELEQRLEGEAGWARYQRQMAAAFDKVGDLEEFGGTAATKAEAWQRFLAVFATENPLSDADDDLRRRAGERLSYWLGQPPVVEAAPAATADSATPPPQAQPGDGWSEPEIGMKFRFVPGGRFQMGSPTSESGRDLDETQHEVTLSRGFWIGETEVTQEQWREILGNNPSRFESCGETCPVERVSWFEAIAFANALSARAALPPCYEVSGPNGKKAGEGLEYDRVEFQGVTCRGYRLPTEAEWERAARAGEGSAIYTGDMTIRGKSDSPELDPIAWYGGNSGVSYEGGWDCSDWPEKQLPNSNACGTHPVGQKQASVWGLRDVLGNVWEWTWDRFATYPTKSAADPTGPPTGSIRVIRGGSWGSGARYCRSAIRDGGAPGYRSGGVGFRLVRTP